MILATPATLFPIFIIEPVQNTKVRVNAILIFLSIAHLYLGKLHYSVVLCGALVLNFVCHVSFKFLKPYG